MAKYVNKEEGIENMIQFLMEKSLSREDAVKVLKAFKEIEDKLMDNSPAK